MRVKVSFRYNAATGRVEEFRVDDLDQTWDEEHDQQHEDIALRLGLLVERDPLVNELLPEQDAATIPQEVATIPQDAATIPQEVGVEQDEELPAERRERRFQ
ncbi:hypothetical protein [Kitasatospora sp. NPDC047058]|uniref:hypothetical protein n=1 Tax=Kitasatospora sp. NPDC047058 TaxID=3155620 RepID=UPI0033CBCC10